MKKYDNKIDILINNSGRSVRANGLEMDFENEEYIMNLNFMSKVALTKVRILR